MEDFEVEAFRLRLAGEPTGVALARRLAETEVLVPDGFGGLKQLYPNPYRLDPSETVLAAQVAQAGGALAWSDDTGDACDCGFCVPGERRAA